MGNNHLHIGGIDVIDLANKYGTPLFVYDVNKIRNNARSFVSAFKKHDVNFKVSYASKAFSTVAIIQVMKQEGLNIDVVSEGELYTAIKADFPRENIHMHGNNKSIEELELAIDEKIGCIVVDNFYEISLLEGLLEEKDETINILLRMTPGIEASTHDYILTGQEDSKFGFDLESDQADNALKKLINHPRLNVKGVHCHIGSQIFDADGYILTIQKLVERIKKWKTDYDFTTEVLNVGGGFGIQYTDEDQPLSIETFVDTIVQEVKKEVNEKDLNMPEIWIEPGRAIVGEAGITVYTVGSIKDIPGIRKYVSIDGGMTDNLRPALYNAKYNAVIANKLNEPNHELVSIAGKCCETGDMLIWDLNVPTIESGDYLAVLSTGAYGYSMANNYNRFPKPAVVFVEDGKDKLVVKRETTEDLIRYDLSYE